MSVLVLSAGRDAVLLKTRNEVLLRIGCIVTPVGSSSDLVNQFFDGDYDLIVLCHSIPPEERHKILRLVKYYRPSMHAILVTDFAEATSDDGHGLQFGERVLSDPEALVGAVNRSFPQLPGPI